MFGKLVPVRLRTVLLDKVLAPSSSLMGHLSLARKCAVMAVVLLVPLGFVANAYLGEQGTQISFAQKERVGVAYLKPASVLVDSLVQARAAAVAVAAGTAPASEMSSQRTAVEAAVAGVNADGAAARVLSVTGEWNTLESQIKSTLAAPLGSPQTAFNAYDALATSAITLVVTTATNSKLILDPVLDSYYSIEALVNQLPEPRKRSEPRRGRATCHRRHGTGPESDTAGKPQRPQRLGSEPRRTSQLRPANRVQEHAQPFGTASAHATAEQRQHHSDGRHRQPDSRGHRQHQPNTGHECRRACCRGCVRTRGRRHPRARST